MDGSAEELHALRALVEHKQAVYDVERLRAQLGFKGKTKVAATRSVPTDGASPLAAMLLPQDHRGNKLSRVSSDSRVDELLAQAYMALESLTPEAPLGPAAWGPRGASPPHALLPPLRPLAALAPHRKENGKSYKDLTQILQDKMQELDEALVRRQGRWKVEEHRFS